MNISADDIIKSLPEDRQDKIRKMSQQKIEDTLTYVERLSNLRNAVAKPKPQAEIAKTEKTMASRSR